VQYGALIKLVGEPNKMYLEAVFLILHIGCWLDVHLHNRLQVCMQLVKASVTKMLIGDMRSVRNDVRVAIIPNYAKIAARTSVLTVSRMHPIIIFGSISCDKDIVPLTNGDIERRGGVGFNWNKIC